MESEEERAVLSSSDQHAVMQGSDRTGLAPRWTRIAAFLIDAVVLSVPFGFLVGVLIQALDPSEGETGQFWLLFALITVAFVAVLAVVGWVEGVRGWTAGKYALGTRTVDATSGGFIGPKRGLIRRAAWALSGMLLVGWMRIGWDRGLQGWHDRAARSVVVRSSPSTGAE